VEVKIRATGIWEARDGKEKEDAAKDLIRKYRRGLKRLYYPVDGIPLSALSVVTLSAVDVTDAMKKTTSLYHGHQFPATIISHAMHWCFRFQLSLRDIEGLLFERGVTVCYESIRRWSCGGCSVMAA
jgi:hypothetical protein